MKHIIEVNYDFDGSDVDAETIKETLQESLNCHVEIQEYHEPDVPEELKKIEDKGTKDDPKLDVLLTLNTMLHVGGGKDAFRCGCGSNVFSKMQDAQGIYYECHGCWTVYREVE